MIKGKLFKFKPIHWACCPVCLNHIFGAESLCISPCHLQRGMPQHLLEGKNIHTISKTLDSCVVSESMGARLGISYLSSPTKPFNGCLNTGPADRLSLLCDP